MANGVAISGALAIGALQFDLTGPTLGLSPADSASVSDLGKAKIRFNLSTQRLEQSINAGTWIAIASSGTAGSALAQYVVNVPDGSLPNAQPLSALGTGIVKNTTTTGALSIAIANTDFPAVTGRYIVYSATAAPPNAQNLGILTSGILRQDVSTGIASLSIVQTTATSVIGRSVNSLGDPGDIAATASGQFLRRDGSNVLGFGTITTADLPASVQQNIDLGIDNLTALGALSITNLNSAALRFVKTVRDFFRLDKTSTLTSDGITIVTASGGTGRWLRLLLPDASWTIPTSWTINPSTGNDEALGDAGHPLLTVSEFHRRLWNKQPLSTVTCFITSNLNAGDTLQANFSISLDTVSFTKFVEYRGTPRLLATATITSHVVRDGSSGPNGTNGTITVNALPGSTSWTTGVGGTSFIHRLIEWTDGTNFKTARIEADLGGTTAWITQPMDCNTNLPKTFTDGDVVNIYDEVDLGQTVTHGTTRADYWYCKVSGRWWNHSGQLFTNNCAGEIIANGGSVGINNGCTGLISGASLLADGAYVRVNGGHHRLICPTGSIVIGVTPTVIGIQVEAGGTVAGLSGSSQGTTDFEFNGTGSVIPILAHAISGGKIICQGFCYGTTPATGNAIQMDGRDGRVSLSHVPKFSGSQSIGFTLAGTSDSLFSLFSRQADDINDNVVVGPGGPTLNTNRGHGITHGATASGVADSFPIWSDVLGALSGVVSSGISATFVAGEIPFGHSTNGSLIQDTSLFWDNVNKRIGIGTLAPISDLDIFRSGTTFTTARVITSGISTTAGAHFFATNGLTGISMGITGANYTSGTATPNLGSATSFLTTALVSNKLYIGSSGELTFQTGTTQAERIRVRSNGEVDILSLSVGGLIKAITPSGQLTIATPGTDYALPTVNMIAGSGIAGGGTTASDRTFNIGTVDATITVNADTIQVGTIGTTNITDAAVTSAKLRNSGALSVIGRATNSSGVPADISATSSGQFLKRDGNNNLGFSAILLSDLPAGITSGGGGGGESPLTFISPGNTRTSNTITNDVITGLNGGLTVTGGTGSADSLLLRATSHATPGTVVIAGGADGNTTAAVAINNGNNVGTTGVQLSFGFAGNTNQYRQSIRTRHNSGAAAGNSIDFFTWIPGDTRDVMGSLRAMSINGGLLELPGYSAGGLLKAAVTTGIIGFGVSGTDYELPLTFNTGLTRVINTITNDVLTGHSGNQTWIGSTDSAGQLIIEATSHATPGLMTFVASTIEQRNSTNPQTFNIYNTFTSSTNYERASFNWASNVFTIQTQHGSSGTGRSLSLGTNNQTWLTINSTGVARFFNKITYDDNFGAITIGDIGMLSTGRATGFINGAERAYATIDDLPGAFSLHLSFGSFDGTNSDSVLPGGAGIGSFSWWMLPVTLNQSVGNGLVDAANINEWEVTGTSTNAILDVYLYFWSPTGAGGSGTLIMTQNGVDTACGIALGSASTATRLVSNSGATTTVSFAPGDRMGVRFSPNGAITGSSRLKCTVHARLTP